MDNNSRPPLIAYIPEHVKPRLAIAALTAAFIFLLTIALKTSPTPRDRKVDHLPTPTASNAQSKPREKFLQNTASGSNLTVKTPTDELLLKRLYAEYPELDPSTVDSQKVDDWGKVSRLREFSYRHTAFAASRDQAAYQAGSRMVKKLIDGQATLADAYGFLDRAEGGVLDAEAADLLQRLYAALNFEAYSLEIGVPPTPTQRSNLIHSLNLVRIKVTGPGSQSRSILSVHDPSLNVAYCDSQGRPIDYFEMLELLVQRQAERIHFAGPAATTSSHSDPVAVAFNSDLEETRPADFAGCWTLGVSPVWSMHANGNWIVRGPRTVSAFERVGDETWKPELFKAGLPPESIYMHCFPLQIRGAAEASTLLEQSRQLLSRGAASTTHTASDR